MHGMETFLIGAFGGAAAALTLSKLNQFAQRWQSAESAIMAHDAMLAIVAKKVGLPVPEDPNHTEGQYL
jgi:hypothetical protein